MIFMTAKVMLGFGSEHDRQRVAHGLGWWAPEMRPHWQRLWADIRYLDWRDGQHAITNISTEWVRLDAQRAQKFYLTIIAGLLVWLAVK